MGLQYGNMKPDGKASPATPAWKSFGLYFSSIKLAVKEQGVVEQMYIEKFLYLFDRTLCTVSVTLLVSSSVILMAFL